MQQKRLNSLLEAIDNCDTFFDICADHGHLAYQVYKNGIAKNVIASDIRETCFKQMQQKYGRFIEVRKGDGFDILKDDDNLDTVLIAGVGAKTIEKILNKATVNFEKYIFSPHQDVEEFREYLVSNNFQVYADYMIRSGQKYYSIIKCKRGKMQRTEQYIYFGLNTLDNEIFKMYLKDLNEYVEKALNEATSQHKEKLEKLRELSGRYFNG